MHSSTPLYSNHFHLKTPASLTIFELKKRKSFSLVDDLKHLSELKKVVITSRVKTHKKESASIIYQIFLDLVKKPRKTIEDIKVIREQLSEIQFFKKISSSLSEIHLNSLIQHSTYELQMNFSVVFKYGIKMNDLLNY